MRDLEANFNISQLYIDSGVFSCVKITLIY